MTPWLIVLPDEWVAGGVAAVFSVMTFAIRTLYTDLGRKGERTSGIITELTKAVQELTTEVRKRAG